MNSDFSRSELVGKLITLPAEKLRQMSKIKGEIELLNGRLLKIIEGVKRSIFRKIPQRGSLTVEPVISKPRVSRVAKVHIVTDLKKALRLRFKEARPGNAIEAEIVEEYLPMVKTVAGRIATSIPPHVDIQDLYSSGLVGLLNGVRNYDPRGGSTFESYARVRIRGAIYDELRRLDWVPRSIHDKARKVQRVRTEVEQTLGRIPEKEEMAKALGISINEYDELVEEIRPATFVCLDAAPCADEEGETTRYESLVDYSQPSADALCARKEVARIVANDLESLPDMQRKVLALYYFKDLRLREIAETFGVTESRICQIHAAGINFLRERLRELDEFPEVGI